MTSQYHNNNDSRPSQNTGLFVSNAGNKAILMLGSATAALVGNYLLTNFYDNRHPHDKKKKLAPKTNAPDPLADTRRDELVIRSQSREITRLRQVNRDLVAQLEATSDHLNTCEAEALRTEQCLQALLHTSKKEPGSTKIIIHHNINHDDDDDDKPQSMPNDLTTEGVKEEEEGWRAMTIKLANEMDELSDVYNKLVVDRNAIRAEKQAISDKNAELRISFAKQLDEATRAFDLKTQDMQTKLEQATAEIAIAKQGKKVSKSSSKKKK